MADADKQSDMMESYDNVLRQVLEPSARARLYNVRLVNPNMYARAAQVIVNMYENGTFNSRISDEVLKDILQRLNVKREISITRK